MSDTFVKFIKFYLIFVVYENFNRNYKYNINYKINNKQLV